MAHGNWNEKDVHILHNDPLLASCVDLCAHLHDQSCWFLFSRSRHLCSFCKFISFRYLNSTRMWHLHNLQQCLFCIFCFPVTWCQRVHDYMMCRTKLLLNYLWSAKTYLLSLSFRFINDGSNCRWASRATIWFDTEYWAKRPDQNVNITWKIRLVRKIFENEKQRMRLT